MTPEDFDAHFDRFSSTVFRLETLQDYTASEAERVAAFLRGEPRPERSIRTSPWLARVARTTLEGKSWQRVRVIEEPVTDYTRYELEGYVESQAAGEQIRIARRAGPSDFPKLAALRRDFWLFDAGLTGEFALLMHYGPRGRFNSAELITGTQVLDELVAEHDLAVKWSVPLNQYLAQRAQRAA